MPVRFRIDGLSRQDILGAKDGFFRFDAEISREQQAGWALHVPRDSEYDEPDDGVIRKEGADQKVYLHYRPDLEQLLAQRGVLLTAAHQEWLAHCARIHGACCNALLDLARKMDLFRSGFNFTRRVEEAWDEHVLRILKYEPRSGNLARCHTDRCAITYHIAESADGFRARQAWDTIPYRTPQSPEVLCFSGLQFERITRGAVPAVYHEVVDTTGGTEQRFAMVFFGKMLKDPKMF